MFEQTGKGHHDKQYHEALGLATPNSVVLLVGLQDCSGFEAICSPFDTNFSTDGFVSILGDLGLSQGSTRRTDRDMYSTLHKSAFAHRTISQQFHLR